MKLNIQERLTITKLMPTAGDFLQQSIVKEILAKTEITPAEKEKIGFRIESLKGESLFRWDDIAYEKSVKFENIELTFLKDKAKSFDENKKITQENFVLIKKIGDAVIENKFHEREVLLCMEQLIR